MTSENPQSDSSVPAARMGLSRRAGTIALALIGTLAGLLLAEAAVAILYPQLYRRPPVWEFDSGLGWRHTPNASGRLVSPEFDVEVSINGAGLRERPVDRAKPPATSRILVFGDSFVEGWGVAAEECLSRRLEAHLIAPESAPRVQVLNFGVAGYGTDQASLFFESQGRHYAPDCVIIVFYSNDLWNNASRRGIGAERGYKPYFRPGRRGGLELRGVPVPRARFWDVGDEDPVSRWYRPDRYLVENWHLYALLRRVLAPEVTQGEQRAFYGGLYSADAAGEFAPVWDLTSRIIARFAERIRQSGARPLLVYAPSIVQVDGDHWRTKRELHGLVGEDYDLGKPNRILAAIAAQCDVPLVDLDPVFAAANQDPPLYFRDSHWTARGHELAARTMAEAVRGLRGLRDGEEGTR